MSTLGKWQFYFAGTRPEKKEKSRKVTNKWVEEFTNSKIQIYFQKVCNIYFINLISINFLVDVII